MGMLISKKEVIEIAFSAIDQATEGVIKEAKIIAAQEEYLRPVFGGLYTAWLAGKYTEFVTQYIKQPLAFFVRYGVIPDMAIQMGNNGLTMGFTTYSSAATDKQREMLRTQAMKDAEALLKEAVRQVECNKDKYPEYEPRNNIKKHVKRPGGVIL